MGGEWRRYAIRPDKGSSVRVPDLSQHVAPCNTKPVQVGSLSQASQQLIALGCVGSVFTLVSSVPPTSSVSAVGPMNAVTHMFGVAGGGEGGGEGGGGNGGGGDGCGDGGGDGGGGDGGYGGGGVQELFVHTSLSSYPQPPQQLDTSDASQRRRPCSRHS